MRLRYFDIIVGLFVAVLLISNVASTKIVCLGPFSFDGGTILFPLAYIFGDILTEVNGYRKARPVIWTGFACALLMSVVFIILGKLPGAPDWSNQVAYDKILGLTPRLVIASLLAYWMGEFTNSITLAKMKIRTAGRFLWARTIASTVLGEGVDTMVFVMVAFWGILPGSLLTAVIISNYLFKVGVEVIFTPLTYWIVRTLKRRENIDTFDYQTRFNPFALQD